MRPTRPIIFSLFVLFSATVIAAPPEQVFARTSKSIVVVQAYGPEGALAGLGSGVATGREQVVTNCHVVQEGNQYRLSHAGKSYEASLQYADTERDLCQLRVPGLKAPAVRVVAARRLLVGQRVYALGTPHGLDLTLSEGLISSLRGKGEGRFIQTTAPISPGSSGGGLFDAEGRLVGITTFQMSGGQNLNFAVPADWIAHLQRRAAPAIADATDLAIHALVQVLREEPGSAGALLRLGMYYSLFAESGKGEVIREELRRADPVIAERVLGVFASVAALGQGN